MYYVPVFFTKIISGENNPKLNSDFAKLKLVILPLDILVFSPSYNSKTGEFTLLLKIPFFA